MSTGFFFGGRGNKNVLKLDSVNGCTIVNMLKTIDLYILNEWQTE